MSLCLTGSLRKAEVIAGVSYESKRGTLDAAFPSGSIVKPVNPTARLDASFPTATLRASLVTAAFTFFCPVDNIRSCFGSGGWNDMMGWDNDEGWNNG